VGRGTSHTAAYCRIAPAGARRESPRRAISSPSSDRLQSQVCPGLTRSVVCHPDPEPPVWWRSLPPKCEASIRSGFLAAIVDRGSFVRAAVTALTIVKKSFPFPLTVSTISWEHFAAHVLSAPADTHHQASSRHLAGFAALRLAGDANGLPSLKPVTQKSKAGRARYPWASQEKRRSRSVAQNLAVELLSNFPEPFSWTQCRSELTLWSVSPMWRMI
jgi:hypothetical protein